MTIMEDQLVTAVIINYKTPDLTSHALSTFRAAYQNTPVLLIDNASDAAETTLKVAIEAAQPGVRLIENQQNLHHGPAMHQAMGLAKTPYVLFLDSDCTVEQPGFIELMAVQLLAQVTNYASGPQQYVNNRGFPVSAQARGAILYISPWCMLVKRELYSELPPFELHGAPVLSNMLGATKRGFSLIGLSLDKYVTHACRGTAGRFGYGLGLKGKINHLMNKFGM